MLTEAQKTAAKLCKPQYIQALMVMSKALKTYFHNQLFTIGDGVLYWTILLVSHERLLYLCSGLCFSHWFEVDGAYLEKRDVENVHAPIMIAYSILQDQYQSVWSKPNPDIPGEAHYVSEKILSVKL